LREKRRVNDVAERAFRRHYGQVYRYVRRRTLDHDRAEELTQQVFADAAAGLKEHPSPTLSWLYTVARRRFADETRGRLRAHIVPLRDSERDETREYGPAVAGGLSQALAALPGGQREVVVLKLLRGLRFAEIAGALGVTEDAAKMRFVRGLQTLRFELEQTGIEP
jgi:RNA polymerase sigma-70 factor (ECF subfamily)